MRSVAIRPHHEGDETIGGVKASPKGDNIEHMFTCRGRKNRQRRRRLVEVDAWTPRSMGKEVEDNYNGRLS